MLQLYILYSVSSCVYVHARLTTCASGATASEARRGGMRRVSLLLSRSVLRRRLCLYRQRMYATASTSTAASRTGRGVEMCRKSCVDHSVPCQQSLACKGLANHGYFKMAFSAFWHIVLVRFVNHFQVCRIESILQVLDDGVLCRLCCSWRRRQAHRSSSEMRR
mgnify:CR=1 FL=1